MRNETIHQVWNAASQQLGGYQFTSRLDFFKKSRMKDHTSTQHLQYASFVKKHKPFLDEMFGTGNRPFLYSPRYYGLQYSTDEEYNRERYEALKDKLPYAMSFEQFVAWKNKRKRTSSILAQEELLDVFKACEKVWGRFGMPTFKEAVEHRKIDVTLPEIKRFFAKMKQNKLKVVADAPLQRFLEVMLFTFGDDLTKTRDERPDNLHAPHYGEVYKASQLYRACQKSFNYDKNYQAFTSMLRRMRGEKILNSTQKNRDAQCAAIKEWLDANPDTETREVTFALLPHTNFDHAPDSMKGNITSKAYFRWLKRNNFTYKV